jgi:hypothetical protein
MQIYKITNLINKKFYIGKDTSSDSNYFGSGLLIKKAIKKYGIENFKKEILDETNDYEDLSIKEKYWINHFNSTNLDIGYNITKGGDGGDTLSKHPNLDSIKEKISNSSIVKGKTYEEAFGEEKAKEYKEKLKSKMNLSIFSKKSKENSKLFFDKKREELIKRCQFIREEIKNGKIVNYFDELKDIKESVYWNFLKNSEGFYNFFGEDLKFIFGKLKINENNEFEKINKWILEKDIKSIIIYMKKLPKRIFKTRENFYEYIGEELKLLIKNELKLNNKKNESSKIEVIIDGKEYESIFSASTELNIEREIIRYRLKSSNFKNYLFKDNYLNAKFNKHIDYDQYEAKRQKISIAGIKYDSITEATQKLNKTHDYIIWRLTSKSYTDWFYLNKQVELKDTGEQKLKKISIDGIIYESIAEAVRQTGIDRQIMRYRLKSKNHENYFYI